MVMPVKASENKEWIGSTSIGSIGNPPVLDSCISKKIDSLLPR
jgi:hypothetical protein